MNNKTQHILIALLALLTLAVPHAAGQATQWTTIDGKTKTLEAVSTDGQQIFFRVAGRVVGVPIARLHPVSQSNVFNQVAYVPAKHNAPKAGRIGSKFGAQAAPAADPVVEAQKVWAQIRTKFVGAPLHPSAQALRQQLVDAGLDLGSIRVVGATLRRVRTPAVVR